MPSGLTKQKERKNKTPKIIAFDIFATLALNLILFASSTSNALRIFFLSIEMYISEGIEKMRKAMKVRINDSITNNF